MCSKLPVDLPSSNVLSVSRLVQGSLYHIQPTTMRIGDFQSLEIR